MPQTTPQDRKPKAKEAAGSHTFTVAGKTYTLPPVTEEAATSVPGEITHAAIMAPNDGATQARLAFATLDACKPSEKAKAALLSLPTGEMMEVLMTWMGEPSGSSA